MPFQAPYRTGSRRTTKASSNGHLRLEDFPLGSPESRAAARLRLKELETPPQYHEIHVEAPPKDAAPGIPWFGPWEKISGVTINERTGFNESKHDPEELLAALFYRNGDFKRRVYSPPAAWRVLEVGEVNVYDVPCCPGCGTAFAESGRYGILVQFSNNCADRHDPAPQKRPPAKPSPEEERFQRVMKEVAASALFDLAVGDIKEYLAAQLGIHRSSLDGYISGRQEATAALRQQIASLLPDPARPTYLEYDEWLKISSSAAPGPGDRARESRTSRPGPRAGDSVFDRDRASRHQ